MTLFKEYKNILGEPNKGVHSYRFMDAALADYAMTIMLAAFISFKFKVPLVLSTICCFSLGLFLHFLFGVPTSSLKFMGLM